jgi:hypothetical protein
LASLVSVIPFQCKIAKNTLNLQLLPPLADFTGLGLADRVNSIGGGLE